MSQYLADPGKASDYSVNNVAIKSLSSMVLVPIDQLLFQFNKKNPAYGRQRISRPMWIVGPIQFWRGWVIYLFIY